MTLQGCYTNAVIQYAIFDDWISSLSISFRLWYASRVLFCLDCFCFIAELYECARVYLTIHSLKDTCVFSIIGLLWIKQLWTFRFRFLCKCKFSFLCNKCPGVQMLGHVVTAYLVFLIFLEKLLHCFLEWLKMFTFFLATCEWSGFSEPSPTFDIVILFYFSQADRCVVILHCVFKSHFS